MSQRASLAGAPAPGPRRPPAKATAAGPVAVLLGLLMLALAVLISGCGGGGESPVGTWISGGQGEILELRADGTATWTRQSGAAETLVWQADDANLALGVEGGDTRTFDYSIKEGVLTLTFPGEEPAQYTRVESEGY